ncbi:MAG: acyl carrier protein [Bacteroidales bacterium]|nr:acyl carrier protein [Bacteroidales bacterium]
MEQIEDILEIKDKLNKYVQDTAFTDFDKIEDNTLLFEEGILDSMGLISLITFLEETFNIKISDTDLELENFKSIDAMAGFVESRS